MSEITISAEVGLDVEVSCGECGADLKVSLQGDNGVIFVVAEPCQNCMGFARSEGHYAGYEECLKDQDEGQ